MASVRRVPRSPYWIAKFRDGDCIAFRSTKQRIKSDALQVALDWERLASQTNRGEVTQATVLKFANELLERVGQEPVGKISTADFGADWLKRGIKADSTRKRYESVVNGFLKFIGPLRAKATIGSITSDEIERFRDEEVAKGKTASTAAFGVKVLRAMFESAKRKSQRVDNPADGVESIPVSQQERRPFADDQISAVLSVAGTAWKGMILLGAFGGLRLNDAANLLWSQVDLEAETIKFVPSKTIRKNPKPITVAMHRLLVQHLKSRTLTEKPQGQLFPALAGKKSGSAGGLSNQFASLLVQTGIRAQSEPSKKREEGDLGRKFNDLGFHSTRHFFISKMANADVPKEVRKALAGHSPDDAHSRYSHLDVSTQKRALEKLTWGGPESLILVRPET